MSRKKRAAKTKRTKAKASLLTKVIIFVLMMTIGWKIWDLQGQVKAARLEEAEYAARVSALQEENDALEADIAEGATSDKMEALAREELGLVTPDEYVFFDTSN